MCVLRAVLKNERVLALTLALWMLREVQVVEGFEGDE